MSFPLCNINNIKGSCSVHNFSPNNWEKVSIGDKVLWALYSDGHKWICKKVSELNEGESKTIFYDDLILIQRIIHPNSSSTETSLPPVLNELPMNEFQYSSNPEWRSTVAFLIKIVKLVIGRN